MRTNNIKKTAYIIFAGLFCLLPICFLICGFLLPPQYHDTFLGEMKYKIERLQNTPGKKIVLIGGSGVPFSIKSEQLHAAIKDYEIVDFGLYADMGTPVMLDWAKANVQEGDIYILMPEQHSQTLSDYFSGETVWQALDGDFSSLTMIDSAHYEQLAISFPSFAARKLYDSLHGMPESDGIYKRASFNQYGDIACAGREYNMMDDGYNPNDLISFSKAVITDDFIDEMNEFAAYVNARGASVYYHFPAMNKLALTDDTSVLSIDNYYDDLSDALTFPILGNPHHSIMDAGWFYDTNFHPNDSGAAYFTNIIIDDLKIVLEDTSSVTLPEVAMPELSDSANRKFLAEDYNNEDADSFTYQKTDNGWMITGFNNSTSNASELIVPGYYQNLPVIGITETAFHNCTTLRSITLQPNIGTLYDDMFHGCPNLHTLTLTGTPSDYTVGSELLGTLNYQIQVPADQIDTYKRHYSWQKYATFLTTQEAVAPKK